MILKDGIVATCLSTKTARGKICLSVEIRFTGFVIGFSTVGMGEIFCIINSCNSTWSNTNFWHRRVTLGRISAFHIFLVSHLYWKCWVTSWSSDWAPGGRAGPTQGGHRCKQQVQVMPLGDWKGWSQDLILPRPHLRVGNGREGFLMENPVYLRTS